MIICIMKKKLTLFFAPKHLLFTVVALTVLFFISGCGSSKKVVTAPSGPVAPTPAPPPPPKEVVKDPVKDEKVSLSIALMMPFSLDKNFAESDTEKSGEEAADEPHIEPSSLNALHFYEGALLAADSLKSLKKEIKIVAVETPSDSAGIARTMISKQIKNAAFVIGTFPNNLSGIASDIAKREKVNMVLTQSGSSKVTENNEYVALSNASTVTQIKEMVDFMMESYPASNFILVFRNTRREDEMAAIFRQEILRLKENADFRDLNATEKPYKDIANLISKTKRNVVFLVSSDEAFVSPVLAFLESQEIFGIYISGLPPWQSFESIDFMNFKNLQVFLFDNNFVDYDHPMVKAFRQRFMGTYYTDPLASGYNGFDLVYRIASAYVPGENNFTSVVSKAFSGMHPFYDFDRPVPGNGVENKYISVLRFNDYKLERINQISK